MATLRKGESAFAIMRNNGRTARNQFQDNFVDARTEYSDEASSADGAESILFDPGDPRDSLVSAITDYSLDVDLNRAQLIDELDNKHLQPDETALMLKQFERNADIRFARSYRMGKAVQDAAANAYRPQIGLVLLPGADLPEVNRLEQSGMVSKTPNQKTAIWRVSTAGSLLSNVTIQKDLTLVNEDLTERVVDSVRRRTGAPGSFDKFRRANSDGVGFSPPRRDTVSIDSDNVEIVNDFSEAKMQLDLGATLIEVDVSALWCLMHDYKHIITNSGPNMTLQQTKGLLDRMMESARRFCVRSPILFRMSTRIRVIKANDIRYGVDNELAFRTCTTSKGIQEIIHMAASYYNSLNPDSAGMDKESQNIIRPRFLQMLTLLLCLLNDDDLQEMADFIHKTYGFSHRREDIELLFLRVIPLTSINAKVFLQGLIPATESDQWSIPPHMADNLEGIWTNFIKRLAKRGYLLPGRVEDFGRRESSWIYKWPDEGIHSSTVFSRLQFHGERSSAFNDVPTARFSYESDMAEITVKLSNNETYIIRAADYEQISTLTQGHYTLMKEDGTICDLEISETVLNGAINEAVRKINEAIAMFNAYSRPQSKKNQKSLIWRGKSGEPPVFRDIDAANRVTRNQAMVEGDLLAVAYKLHGRNVPRSQAIRYMAQYYNKVTTLFSRLQQAAGRSVSAYENIIGRVINLLEQDRSARDAEKRAPRVSDAPIAHAVTSDDTSVPSPKVWYEYHISVARVKTGRDQLHVRANSYYVATVNWIHPGQQAEVTLGANQTRFFVAPLNPVAQAEQDEEVRVGDVVLLLGRYMVVAEPRQNDFEYPCIMVNWLEIQDANVEAIGRRGRNRDAKEVLPLTIFE